MNRTLLLWTDETAGRQTKFVVDYKIDGDMLHVLDLTPTEVSILNIVSLTVEKKIIVRTKSAQNLLKNRFIEAGMLDQLVDRIAKNHGLAVVS